MIKLNDVIALDFFNASPDFDENQTYSVSHFIKMRKVRYEKTSISKKDKIFRKYTKDNVHYRRGLGLVVVKGQMENALKMPFQSYGKPDIMASLMILVDTKSTPNSAIRFLLKKINMIKEGDLSSSPRALNYVEKRLMEEMRKTYGPHKWTKTTKLEKDGRSTKTIGAPGIKKPKPAHIFHMATHRFM